MNRQLEIEARLERSLRRQVSAPRLDGRFDAAVWSRIEREEQRTAQSSHPPTPARAPARTPRWLVASNLIGAGVAVTLILVSVARSLTGVELPELAVELPQVSPDRQRSLLMMGGHLIAALALGFGMTFTRLGRKVRAALS